MTRTVFRSPQQEPGSCLRMLSLAITPDSPLGSFAPTLRNRTLRINPSEDGIDALPCKQGHGKRIKLLVAFIIVDYFAVVRYLLDVFRLLRCHRRHDWLICPSNSY